MIIHLFLVAVAVLVASSLLVAVLARADRAALVVGTVGGVGACALGACAAVFALLQGQSGDLKATWSLPIGELHLGFDGLSAFFLLCVFLVSGLSAFYGAGYLKAYIGKKRVAAAAALFNLLVASMALVVLSRDGVLFLLAWEMMSVSSFFLVTFESEREDVRRAGLTYLIASHIGVVFLIALFALLAREAGSFDFHAFAAIGAGPEGFATLCFAFALIGFGTKAGFWPLHIWLPDAHPAAPSHVSAVMSGVMIKLGIYGILRTLTFLGEPPAWWGVAFIAIGAVSGVGGVLHSLAQRDLKRLLAYCSVENVGVIALGIGIGLLGQTYGNETVAFLGYAGGLLHVLNHGLFKGLLFQGAGSVIHGALTRHIDSLGGLSKRMPVTGFTFFIGAMAISGLPPFNGFVSEFLIYLGAFRGTSSFDAAPASVAVLAFVSLALIGGIASATFVKAFGMVFLGEPRTETAARAHEAGFSMKAAMVLGAALCFGIGVWPAAAVALVHPAAGLLASVSESFTAPIDILTSISLFAGVFLGVALVLALLRKALLRRREVGSASTWGCGYSLPTARMQYTSSSFAEPLLAPFSKALEVEVRRDGLLGPFPKNATYDVHLKDVAGERFIVPAVRKFLRATERLGVLQQGRIQLYLVYIIVGLVALIAWQFAGQLGG